MIENILVAWLMMGTIVGALTFGHNVGNKPNDEVFVTAVLSAVFGPLLILKWLVSGSQKAYRRRFPAEALARARVIK